MKKIIKCILVLAILVCTCGCAQKPSGAVKDYLNGLKNNISQVFDEEETLEMGESDKELYDSLTNALKQFEYEIVNEQVEGEKATVRVKIRAYDMGKVFMNMFTDFFQQALALSFSGASEEEIQALMYKLWKEKLDEEMKAGKNYTEEVDVKLVKKDKKWTVDENDNAALVNAITGGLGTVAEALAEE